MIYISFHDYSDYSEQMHVFSDKSSKEAKDFTERANRYWTKNNTSELGLFYTREITTRQNKREVAGMYGFENSQVPFEIIEYDLWLKKRKENIKSKASSSNVKDLTSAASKFLLDKYDPVFHETEFTHTNLDVRADLFAVTKDRKVITVEVKSNKDSKAP